MYKATKDLIRERNKYTNYPLEVVNVSRLPSMPLGRCMRNSHEYSESNSDFLLVTGWLVYPFNTEKGTTEIVQHWWNLSTKTHKHIDVTIGNFDSCEYVLDMGLYEYASANYEVLESTVGKSLLYKNGKYHAVAEVAGNLEYSNIDSLETKNLFTHYEE